MLIVVVAVTIAVAGFIGIDLFRHRESDREMIAAMNGEAGQDA